MLALVVGKVNKGKRKMLFILALCKSFAFAQAIVKTQTVSCTYLYLLTTMLLLLIIFPLFSKPTKGVSHYGLAIYIKKWRKSLLYSYPIFQVFLKAKEELWKLKYFTMQKYINLQKNPLKQTKILQDRIITLL